MPYRMKTFGWISENKEKMLACWNQFQQTRDLDFHVEKLKHIQNLLKTNKCTFYHVILLYKFIIKLHHRTKSITYITKLHPEAKVHLLVFNKFYISN